MAQPEPNFNSFTSYRMKKQVEPTGNSPYREGIYTHVSGKEAVVTSYDYKKKNIHYETLKQEAFFLSLIAEKQKKRRNIQVTAPALLSVIDKANTLVVIREQTVGVSLHKLSQSARAAAYSECVKELGRLTESLTPDETEKLPRITLRDMKRQFPLYLIRVLTREPGTMKHIMKLAYFFYRNLPREKQPAEQLANRALTPDNIVCTSEQVHVAGFGRMVLAEAGTDTALFPQFFYRSIGNDTLHTYLDTQLDTATKKQQFMRLSAFYALYFADSGFVPFLADNVLPYVAALLRTQNASGVKKPALSVAESV